MILKSYSLGLTRSDFIYLSLTGKFFAPPNTFRYVVLLDCRVLDFNTSFIGTDNQLKTKCIIHFLHLFIYTLFNIEKL